MLLDNVSNVIKRYGNMIDERAQRSLAFDILEELVNNNALSSVGLEEVNHWNQVLDGNKPKDTLSDIFESQKNSDPVFKEEQNAMISDVKNRVEETKDRNSAKAASAIAMSNASKRTQSSKPKTSSKKSSKKSLKNLDSFTDKVEGK